MSIESSSPDRLPTAETILRDLGQSGASGVLEINHPAGEMSHVWVRGGRIYAMQVPGYRPGPRDPPALRRPGLPRAAQRRRCRAARPLPRPPHRPGPGRDGVRGRAGHRRIRPRPGPRPGRRPAGPRGDQRRVPSPDATSGRTSSSPPTSSSCSPWPGRTAIAAPRCLRRVGGAHVTPVLGPPGTGPAQTPLGPYDWALLCRVDGRRDLTELARVCGFTVVEAAQVVADLAMTGLLAIPTPPPEDESTLAPVVALHPPTEPADPQWRFDGTDAGEPDPVAAPSPEVLPRTLARAAGRVRCPAARRPGPSRGTRRPRTSRPQQRIPTPPESPQGRGCARPAGVLAESALPTPPWRWSSRRRSRPWPSSPPGPRRR